ncbi:MAG TPA: VOC family protein [Longimicrobiaceae bacterium]|nr:VOC family protein [Longimicrobiaceae bacterium]
MQMQMPRIFPQDRPVLGSPRIVSLVVHVPDLPASRDFFAGVLGLPVVADDGRSVRLDAGGVVLDLRPVENGAEPGAVTPVFYAEDLGDAVVQLSRRGIRLAPTVTYSRAGGTARLEAPSGHVFQLWEPSDEARDGPGGRKLEELLAARP